MSRSLLPLLLSTLLGVGAQMIRQWPAVQVRPVGSPLSLQCFVTGTSNPNLYWYWQPAGGAPQLLFFSIGVNDLQPHGPGHLSASRPQDGEFYLSADALQLGDAGVYLCAWGRTLRGPRSRLCKNPFPQGPRCHTAGSLVTILPGSLARTGPQSPAERLSAQPGLRMGVLSAKSATP